MKTNVKRAVPRITTHEGAVAVRINPVQQLRRSVMACMLWEDAFYVDGVGIAQRIHDEVTEVLKQKNGADTVANIAFEARTKFKLRHAPLWLILALARAKTDQARATVAGALLACIQRPDEIPEFVSMYWKDGKVPLSAQVKKGLAAAFQKFDRFTLSKYANRDGAVKMRDVLFLCHAKPKDAEQAQLWKELAANELKAPEDTWEVSLSAGMDKNKVFTELLSEKKLGALALLRNLRNMQQAGVGDVLIRKALLEMKTERVLPFRFITAAKYAPQLEAELEQAMFKCVADAPKLTGKTALVVDHSGSMAAVLSGKSEMTRFEASAALAMLCREVCEEVQVIAFSSSAVAVPPRRGFALRDSLHGATEWGGTNTQDALILAAKLGYDRIIVFTDEQSHQSVSGPGIGATGYFVNVASYQNGIGYGEWVHIDGFSEAVLDYIRMHEENQLQNELK